MVVNGNEYDIPNVDYNTMCDLAMYGADLFGEKSVAPTVLVRAFLALKLGSAKKAGELIQAHIARYGFADMEAWASEIKEAIEEGGFFKAAEAAALREQAKQEKAEKAAAAKAAKKAVTED